MPTEEAERYRARIKEAFYPEPLTPAPRKRIDDPSVFEDLMRQIVREHKDDIVYDVKERFVRSEKKFGAIRSISDEQYLVMPEDTWAAAYKKAAKKADMEIAFCQSTGWEQKLQKILTDADMVKHSKDNPRYRYDLYGTGKKDTTYEVAVPWKDIEPQD